MHLRIPFSYRQEYLGYILSLGLVGAICYSLVCFSSSYNLTVQAQFRSYKKRKDEQATKLAGIIATEVRDKLKEQTGFVAKVHLRDEYKHKLPKEYKNEYSLIDNTTFGEVVQSN